MFLLINKTHTFTLNTITINLQHAHTQHESAYTKLNTLTRYTTSNSSFYLKNCYITKYVDS